MRWSDRPQTQHLRSWLNDGFHTLLTSFLRGSTQFMERFHNHEWMIREESLSHDTLTHPLVDWALSPSPYTTRLDGRRVNYMAPPSSRSLSPSRQSGWGRGRRGRWRRWPRTPGTCWRCRWPQVCCRRASRGTEGAANICLFRGCTRDFEFSLIPVWKIVNSQDFNRVRGEPLTFEVALCLPNVRIKSKKWCFAEN